MALIKRKRKAPYAVLTGDLIRSTDLAPAQLGHARAVMAEAGAAVARWSPDAVAAPVEFFRGDAWQLALGETRLWLRAAIFLRAKLRVADESFDSRIGIGIGKAEQIDPQRTSLSNGDAFTVSGRTLDRLGSASGLAVGLAAPMSGRLEWLDPLAGLCSALADHWTQRQAEIVCRMLVPGDLKQFAVAAELEISKQVVSKALASADYDALARAITHVEEIDWTLEANRPVVKFI